MDIIIKKCKVCSVACDLKIFKDKSNPSSYIVEGNKCARGKDYAIKEILTPSRILTSRVLLKNAHMSRLPVKTNNIIPANLVDQCMDIIRETKVTAPISKGDIIIENILDTGVDLIAARKVSGLK